MPSGQTLTPAQIAQIKALRADGYTGPEVARIVGCAAKTATTHAPGYIGKVPVAPLREAFLRSPVTAHAVARELGWWWCDRPDSSRVKRALGILPDYNGHGSPPKLRAMVDAETVERIADVLGISPWSVLPDDESDVAA